MWQIAATHRGNKSQMRTQAATRLLALILSPRYVARIQTSLNSCDRSQQQNSVAATMIFTCHTRRFVAATCRGGVTSDLSQRVSALTQAYTTIALPDVVVKFAQLNLLK